MTHYTIARENGLVVSQHRSLKAAYLRARRVSAELGGIAVVHEFPGKHKTGRPVMRISFDLETDWKGTPLIFWNNGEPVID